LGGLPPATNLPGNSDADLAVYQVMDTDKKETTQTHSKAGPESARAGLSDPREWVASYGDYLYRFALLRLRDPQLAEDAVQETLLAALKARTSFQGHSTERTWLTGILKRKIIDSFRRMGKEMDLGAEDRTTVESTEPQRPGEWLIDPQDPTERHEFWTYLNACLDRLPQKPAILFVLREVEQMPVEEICNVMGVSPTNLRVSLHRARKQLRNCLEQQWMELNKVKP